MKASDVLKNEHRAIERVLGVLNRAADRLDAGELVPAEVFEGSIDILKNFADRCHHGKEETALFPAMAGAGVPTEGGPIGVMLGEHERGRAYIRAMAESLDGYKRGDPGAITELKESAWGYAALLAQHIRKEELILFPMGDRVLSDEAQQKLIEEFDRIESDHMGPGVHERYHQLIDELEGAVPA